MAEQWIRPSLLRAYIAGNFYGNPIPPNGCPWRKDAHTRLATLVDLAGRVDARLVFDTLSPEQNVQWFAALAAIRSALDVWSGGGDAFVLQPDSVLVIHRLLDTCPDDVAPRALPRLGFIRDRGLRASIARDIDSLEVLFRACEWKAVTVIGGSVVEALLLDVLMRNRTKPQAVAEAAARLANGDGRWKPQPLDKWDLWKLIDMAEALHVISREVASVCTGARNFRNLIHAGVERSKEPCDRATALTARAAVEHVVRSLGGTMS